MCIVVSCLVCIVVVVLCVLLSSDVYLLYYVCTAVFTLDAGLLARSQYSEGPATGHLDTGFTECNDFSGLQDDSCSSGRVSAFVDA